MLGHRRAGQELLLRSCHNLCTGACLGQGHDILQGFERYRCESVHHGAGNQQLIEQSLHRGRLVDSWLLIQTQPQLEDVTRGFAVTCMMWHTGTQPPPHQLEHGLPYQRHRLHKPEQGALTAAVTKAPEAEEVPAKESPAPPEQPPQTFSCPGWPSNRTRIESPTPGSPKTLRGPGTGLWQAWASRCLCSCRQRLGTLLPKACAPIRQWKRSRAPDETFFWPNFRGLPLGYAAWKARHDKNTSKILSLNFCRT